MRGKLTMIAGWALMLATPLAAQAAPADFDSLFDAAGRGDIAPITHALAEADKVDVVRAIGGG